MPGGRSDRSPTTFLAGGMFARVTMQAGPTGKVPAVPKDAVVTRNGVDYVSMVTEDEQAGALMAIPVPVTTGVDIPDEKRDWIAVTSGNLAPGMRVVTKGNENIQFPSPIQIVEFGQDVAETAAASDQPPPFSKAGS
jgi:multidrug efflux pump subunit AcrA (membrane-fusion protein)